MSPLRWSPGPPRAAEVSGELRLCPDLNIWCAAFLSQVLGRTSTASQLLAEAAIHGQCPLGPVRLVVSWPMLTRLRTVLLRDLRIGAADADAYLVTLARAATAEPAGGPYVVLGGTGLVPLHDDEDGRVLEVAVAGRADIVATANFADLVNYRSTILVPGRVALHRTAGHEVVIAHPADVARWVRTGAIRID